MARSIPAALVAVVSAAVSVATLGCGEDPLYQRIRGFEEPTGAKASAHPELAELVMQIEAAGGLSSQLDGARGPDSDNVAAVLAECYSASLHDSLGPVVERFARPNADTAAREEFLKKHALLLSKTIAAVDLPRCRWNVEHRYGYFSSMVYLDDASTAARLLLSAALDDAHTNPDDAAPNALRALRVAHELSKVQRVGARVQAATLRAEALDVINALFRAGVCRKEEAEHVYAALRDQLADWPPDRGMLFGERAAVTHAYEAIRADMLARLITLDERKRLAQSGVLEQMENATPELIDDDQAAYLECIQRLHADADLPYSDRLSSIEAALSAARRDTVFAQHLFLFDLAEAMRLAAADRARCEAWTLALASAAELVAPPFRVNPATGVAYELTHAPQGVVVTLGVAGQEAIAVPLLEQ